MVVRVGLVDAVCVGASSLLVYLSFRVLSFFLFPFTAFDRILSWRFLFFVCVLRAFLGPGRLGLHWD